MTLTHKNKSEQHPAAAVHTEHHKRHAVKSHISEPTQKKKFAKSQSSDRQLEMRNERDIAMDLATQIHRKFGDFVKATILFGSQAKHTARASSDIDIMIIIDDASIAWDLELTSWYREELAKIVSRNKYSEEMHINTIKLTTWWQDLMYGDPVVLNIIRYGEPLIDSGGFFKPLKALLFQGRIHSTPEAVYNALQRAPSHLARSMTSEVGAIEGLYWCMVDSAQAALIMAGQIPPSPEHMPVLLKENFVDKKLLKMELVEWYSNLFELHKNIIHGRIKNVKGADIDIWQERAEQFMKKMTDLVDTLIETQNAG